MSAHRSHRNERNTLHPSTQQFVHKIARLKRLYETCSRESRPGKKRFAFYEYLYEVCVLHAQCRAGVGAGEIKRWIVGASKMPLKADVHVLKLLIDASCLADRKTKSRWGQALRYIWRRRKHRIQSRQQFDRFLNSNGGVVGCAGKIARARWKADPTRLGRGFDLLAFQRRIEAEETDAARSLGPTEGETELANRESRPPPI